MSKINLGYTPGYLLSDSPIAATSPENKDKKKEPPIYYPSVTLEGKSAKKVQGNVNVGDTVTFTVTARVAGMSERDPKASREYDHNRNCTVDLELRSLEMEGMTEKSDSDNESAEGAVDDFLKSKQQPEEGDEYA